MKNRCYKNYFKQYIFGYLSVYYNDLKFCSDHEEYKEFKKRKTINYLSLDPNTILTSSIEYLGPTMEVFIGIVIVLYQFFVNVIRFIFIYNKKPIGKKVVYGLGEKKIHELFLRAKIMTDDIIVVTSPFYSSPFYNEYQNTSLLSGLSFFDFIESLRMSIKMIFFLKWKYGKRDFLFRAHSSFEYFLVCCYFEKLDYSNVVYYTNLIDRWAYLFGNLKHKTVFLQHGIMPAFEMCSCIIRTGYIDTAYYINEEQRKICEKVLFKNIPNAKYLDRMTFTANDKLKRNGKRHLLLICNILFWEKEKSIIEIISNSESWNLYVKPHPTDNPSNYVAMKKKYNFILLDKKDFPEVTQVISYNSSLATEYLDAGIPVLKYTDEHFELNFNKLL